MKPKNMGNKPPQVTFAGHADMPPIRGKHSKPTNVKKKKNRKKHKNS